MIRPEVAPQAGAWIETGPAGPQPGRRQSPLKRGRGLKRKARFYLDREIQSPLKRGAWIETRHPPSCRGGPMCRASSGGRGLKPHGRLARPAVHPVAPQAGGVD